MQVWLQRWQGTAVQGFTTVFFFISLSSFKPYSHPLSKHRVPSCVCPSWPTDCGWELLTLRTDFSTFFQCWPLWLSMDSCFGNLLSSSLELCPISKTVSGLTWLQMPSMTLSEPWEVFTDVSEMGGMGMEEAYYPTVFNPHFGIHVFSHRTTFSLVWIWVLLQNAGAVLKR